jgi:hypothetical protein
MSIGAGRYCQPAGAPPLKRFAFCSNRSTGGAPFFRLDIRKLVRDPDLIFLWQADTIRHRTKFRGIEPYSAARQCSRVSVSHTWAALPELKRRDPRGPGARAVRRVILVGVPERARVRAIESHALVVAPTTEGVQL